MKELRLFRTAVNNLLHVGLYTKELRLFKIAVNNLQQVDLTLTIFLPSGRHMRSVARYTVCSLYTAIGC